MSDYKKTKIVATLGPATDSKETLTELAKEGVNVFRINFSHADYDNVKKTVKTIREINEENREIKGDGYRAEFKKAEFLANENLLSKDFLKFIIDESSEVRTVPEVNKDMITGKRIFEYVEAFQTKRKDSNDYNEALKFLKEYFDDNNKKEIDL